MKMDKYALKYLESQRGEFLKYFQKNFNFKNEIPFFLRGGGDNGQNINNKKFKN